MGPMQTCAPSERLVPSSPIPTIRLVQRPRIAEKRVPEWAQGFVGLCYDQVQAMSAVQVSYKDKNGVVQTARWVDVEILRCAEF